MFLPVPMPLNTAPSLTPEVLVLLVGALWGARLGRKRHLGRTTENRLMTAIRGNSCNRYKTCCQLTWVDIVQQIYCRFAELLLLQSGSIPEINH